MIDRSHTPVRRSVPRGDWAFRRGACLAARGESLTAFDGRCIPADCVAPRSNTPGILGRRALTAGRLARLGATPDSHHGPLAMRHDADRARRTPIEAGAARIGGDRPEFRGDWRVDFTALNYGLDLAAAFVETGDDRFADSWRRIMEIWIRRVALEDEPGALIARRVQNWIFAWRRFRSGPGAPCDSIAFSALIVGSLAQQVLHLRGSLSADATARAFELQALLFAALAMPMLDSDGSLLRFALRALEDGERTGASASC